MLPPVTLALLIANIAVFLLQQVTGDAAIAANFALWPLGRHEVVPLHNGSELTLGFEPWQLVTYSFLHGGFKHIAFNMFALWMFGGPVENALGARRFTVYYFICVLGAALAQLAFVYFFQSEDFYPTVGASGGIFGLLLAFAVLYPQARVALLFFPVPVRAPVFVLGYVVFEFFLGVTNLERSVAHFAHLGGALAGFALIQYWRAQVRNRR
jgi:membrane associated rhomboid family serine protease